MSSIHVVWDLIVVFIFVLSPSTIRSKNKDPTPYYEVCAPFGCGGINFTFPFSDRSTFGSHRLYCGLPGDFLVSCDPSLNQPSVELVPGRFYQIKEIFPASSDRVVTVVDGQLMKDLSLPSFSTSYNSCSVLKDYLNLPGRDIASNPGLYLSSGTVTALNFWICDPQVTRPGNVLFIANSTCNEVGGSGDNRQLNVYAWVLKNTSSAGNPLPKGCRSVELPVLNEVVQTLSRVLLFDFSSAPDGQFKWETVISVMKEYGVSLAWSPIPKCDECLMKNGRCGFEAGNDGVVCFYEGTPGNDKWKIIAGVTVGCLFLIILVSFTYRSIKRRRESSINHDHIQTNDARTKDAQQFIKSYQSTLLTGFSFKDIRKITNGFKEKLGEGGYGSVYKGKLLDGRVVAVKLLDKGSKGDNPHDGLDFINEVQTIGTIHHVNIIRLHGFCVDHGRQALVYEFMPNGSLGDVLRSEGFPSLGTDVMMKIALGVAEGVNYLHQGCDSRILHLDIKPQNVLLDKEYNPKVSDFGLAKVYSRSRSAISMSEVKGTIGFIAPEIIMRNLGSPSDRSDVYSFGMVLLEMIGARKRVNKTSESSSSSSTDTYFPDWIFEELNRNDRGETEIVDNGEDTIFARKMIMVGLWCIQINPRERPPMARVLQMLLGKVESIAMPPKPLFFASSKNLLRIDETESYNHDASSYCKVQESVIVSSLDESL